MLRRTIAAMLCLALLVSACAPAGTLPPAGPGDAPTEVPATDVPPTEVPATTEPVETPEPIDDPTAEPAPEEPVAQDAETLVGGLLTLSSVPFSPPEPATFQWVGTDGETHTVEGWKVTAGDLTGPIDEIVRAYLTNYGLQPDATNDAAEGPVRASAYRNDSLGVLVVHRTGEAPGRPVVITAEVYGGPLPEGAAVDLPGGEGAEAGEDDIADLVAGNTQFALDLYRLLAAGEEGNLFLSPHSISQALAMAYAGAEGDTAAQMAETLGFTLDDERLHAAMAALDEILASRADDVDPDEATGFSLQVANALWGQEGHPFREEFLALLERHYGAGLEQVDFENDSEAAREAINEWVAEQTENLIEDLLAEGDVDALTRLVLVNAIYFQASWLLPFEEAATADGTFYLADGTEVQVPMMHQQDRFQVRQEDDYTAIELPYVGHQMRMTILMPTAGTLEDFEADLDAERLEEILAGLGSGEVRLAMPKFRVESEFKLAEALKALGIEDAFLPDVADFSGMDGTRDLLIDAVAHKAFVEVNEEGTEAAASTAVVMRVTGMPTEVLDVTLDNPFLFLIRDEGTGSVLFTGRLMDPQ